MPPLAAVAPAQLAHAKVRDASAQNLEAVAVAGRGRR